MRLIKFALRWIIILTVFAVCFIAMIVSMGKIQPMDVVKWCKDNVFNEKRKAQVVKAKTDMLTRLADSAKAAQAVVTEMKLNAPAPAVAAEPDTQLELPMT